MVWYIEACMAAVQWVWSAYELSLYHARENWQQKCNCSVGGWEWVLCVDKNISILWEVMLSRVFLKEDEERLTAQMWNGLKRERRWEYIFCVVLSVMELYVSGAAKKISLLYMFHYIDSFCVSVCFQSDREKNLKVGFWFWIVHLLSVLLLEILLLLEIWNFYYFCYYWILIIILIVIILLRWKSLCRISQRILRR